MTLKSRDDPDYHIQPCDCISCTDDRLKSAVYDAAMALWESWCDGDALIESYSDDSAVLADAFDEACRRAKEGT